MSIAPYAFCHFCEKCLVDKETILMDLDNKRVGTIFKLTPCGRCQVVLYCDDCSSKKLSQHQIHCFPTTEILSTVLLDNTLKFHFPSVLMKFPDAAFFVELGYVLMIINLSAEGKPVVENERYSLAQDRAFSQIRRLVKMDESGALYKLVNENKKDLVVSVALNWTLSDRFLHISNYLYKVCKKAG